MIADLVVGVGWEQPVIAGAAGQRRRCLICLGQVRVRDLGTAVR